MRRWCQTLMMMKCRCKGGLRVNVLQIKMQENDADADTIGEYLSKLLSGVIVETEGFSGKRPFGNSGWYIDLVEPLVRAGVAKGEVDEEWGGVDGYDYKEVDAVLTKAIKEALT